MKFGPASPADALGGVTVHTLRQGSLVLKKGTTIGPDEVAALTGAGVKDVVVVRLEDGDVSEDVAAASIARRWRARASMSSAPSRAAPICLRGRRACWSSIAPSSIASMPVDEAITLRRWRPTSRWSKAR